MIWVCVLFFLFEFSIVVYWNFWEVVVNGGGWEMRIIFEKGEGSVWKGSCWGMEGFVREGGCC